MSAAMKVPVHAAAPDQVTAAMTMSGSDPEQHLPGGERQQVDLVPLAQHLRVDGAGRPEERPSDRQEGAEAAGQVPGVSTRIEPAQRQADRRPTGIP